MTGESPGLLDDLVFRYFDRSGAPEFESWWASDPSVMPGALVDLLVFVPEPWSPTLEVVQGRARSAFVDWLYLCDIVGLYGALGAIAPLSGPDWERRIAVLRGPEIQDLIQGNAAPR